MAVGMPLPLLTEEESQVRRGLGILWTRGWVLGEQRQLESWDLWYSWLASSLAGVWGRVETKEFPKSLCLSLCRIESLFPWLAHFHSLFPSLPPSISHYPCGFFNPVNNGHVPSIPKRMSAHSIPQPKMTHPRRAWDSGPAEPRGRIRDGNSVALLTVFSSLWSLLWWPGRHKGKSRTPQENTRGCNFPFVFCRVCDFLLRRAVSAMHEIYVLE